MSRKLETAGRTLDRFRYAPGDGHVYVWTEGQEAITVHKIVAGGLTDTIQSRIVTEPTGDSIPAPDVATATAMVLAVATWKASRP